MDEQHPGEPAPPSRSYPAPVLPSSGMPESGVAWWGRRTLATGERVWVGVGTLFLAGYLTALVVGVADWAQHPVFSGLAALCAVSAVVTLVASTWACRPNHRLVQGWTFRRLPRTTRRDLVRGLRAGDLGPPQLRSWAAYWTTLNLQAPWNPALFLTLATTSAANTAVSGPVETWRLGPLAVLLAFVVIGIISGSTHRRAAHRIADLLDRQPTATASLPPGVASAG